MNTPSGEEFVEGQLVETAFGPKFVPGKVITLKSGVRLHPSFKIPSLLIIYFLNLTHNKEMKFVPGVSDKNGRFVPGQIIDTKG